MGIEKILVLHKPRYEAARALAEEIAAWLRGLGYHASVKESGDSAPIADCDCVVALGGDGTILGIARKLAGKNVPILGINFGRVGFLCASEAADWRENLGLALAGQLDIASCLALSWELVRKGRRLAAGVAANEVALNRGTLARLICVEIQIDDNDLGILRGDGLICCSPLGSSGYSVSAGGPLLYMGLDVMGMTPVCPFLTNIRPLVVSGSSRFSLRIHPASADCYLTIDGQEGQRLETGDLVEVSGIRGAISFFGAPGRFFERLRARGLAYEKL